LTVTCGGLAAGTRIDRHEVAAGPSGVAVSIQPHDQQDQQLALVLDLRRRGPIQIVRGSTTTLPLPPGTHTVACIYEGDLVSGQKSFEVTDPDGYYMAPALTCDSRRIVTVFYDGSMWGPTPIDAARAVLNDRESDDVRIAPYPEGAPRQVILMRDREVLAVVNLRHRGGGWVVSSVQACPGALLTK
jgi:hypothetical protein